MSLLEAAQDALRQREVDTQEQRRREAKALIERRERAIAAAMGALGAWIEQGLGRGRSGSFKIEIAAVVSDHDGVEVDFKVDDLYFLKLKERAQDTRWEGGFAVYLRRDTDTSWTLLSDVLHLARLMEDR